MKCLFEKELAEGTMCCDFGGVRHEGNIEQCPTAIFNLCQACDKNRDFIPETLTWCRQHYVPPVQAHINCPQFGNIDGMDGGCWWCMEMTPYQWHMCSDASWLRGLMRGCPCSKPMSHAQAIEFIEQRKQQHPLGNERKALLSDKDA